MTMNLHARPRAQKANGVPGVWLHARTRARRDLLVAAVGFAGEPRARQLHHVVQSHALDAVAELLDLRVMDVGRVRLLDLRLHQLVDDGCELRGCRWPQGLELLRAGLRGVALCRLEGLRLEGKVGFALAQVRLHDRVVLRGEHVGVAQIGLELADVVVGREARLRQKRDRARELLVGEGIASVGADATFACLSLPEEPSFVPEPVSF